MKTFRYIIGGRVQGVSFRYYTVREALKLGIKGTVRNMEDGNVEVFAQGEEENLSRFERFLFRGPSMARVDFYDRQESPPTEEFFTDFTIIY